MSQNCFTISQAYLGSPLRFEPALGSRELDRLVDAFVHGNASLQQKRAQVSLEFFNAIELSNLPHPVSRRYHVPHQVKTSPSTTSLGFSSPESSASPATSKSLKRARPSSTKDSSSKRLPGFSIMTRDGVDITEYASRGPKSKEQRDHAALMRKLKACGPCKRSKQRCDPSHHRIAASPATTPSSATPSLISGYSWSQASISPQSAIEDSFSRSPNQKARTIAHAGSEFSSPLFESPKLAFSSADMSFNDSLDMSFDPLPLQDVDPTCFQMADMDLNFSVSANVLNPADWAMWNVHTTTSQSFSQSPTSTGRLDQSSPSCLESWDSQRNHQSPPELPQLRQAIQSTWDVAADVDFDVDQLVQYSPYRATGPVQHVSSDEILGVSSITSTSSAPCAQISDYVLYPESPQEGHTSSHMPLAISAARMSEGSPKPTPLTFNADGPFSRRLSGVRQATDAGRPLHEGSATLSQVPDNTEQNHLQHHRKTRVCSPNYHPDVLEGGDIQPHSSLRRPMGPMSPRRQVVSTGGVSNVSTGFVTQSGHSTAATSGLDCRHGLVQQTQLEPTSTTERGISRPSQLHVSGILQQSSEHRESDLQTVQQPGLVIAREVTQQATSNDGWLTEQSTVEEESRRYTSVVDQAQLSPDSTDKSSSGAQSLDDQPRDHDATAPIIRFRRHFNVRHYQIMHSQDIVQESKQEGSHDECTEFRIDSSPQHYSLSSDKHGYWTVSLQEAQIAELARNATGRASNIGIEQSVMPQPLLHESSLISTIGSDVQTVRKERQLSVSHKKQGYSEIGVLSSLEMGDIPAPHLLENAIVTSSSILEQAVHMMKLTLLLSISLVEHCRGIVLMQYAMYTAMTLLVIGSMNYYPQWSLATILVLLKALHSWPNLMSIKHSALEYFSSREDFQELTSQGIPEGNRTCYISSSSSVPPQLHQSESACSSVANSQHEPLCQPPTTLRIESLYSLVSMLSRFCDQSRRSRRFSALKF